MCWFFVFKQKTAYEMRISDWSSDVCSSDLQALTRYLRDPDHCPIPPGMDVARAQVYRDLIFENMRGLLSGTFPVLVNVLGQEAWRACVRRFLREHRCLAPRFADIAEEFVGYLAARQSPDEPAFMAEPHGRAHV